MDCSSWASGIPLLLFNLAQHKWPNPHLSPPLGLLHLQAKGAFCFTSEPCASLCASNIKIEPVLSVQSVKLYIRGCHAAAMRLLCSFYVMWDSQKPADN